MNELADPQYLLPVVRDFPTLQVVLAHGGRGWWYDAAAFMALTFDNVWIELSGLPPKRLPQYYARYDLGRLARRWIFGTDWPGVPATSTNARAVAGLGLDAGVAADVLGRNALKVYAGLGHLADEPDG
jgi:predicted TIM-barrel fold metal-dependent hydrolase